MSAKGHELPESLMMTLENLLRLCLGKADESSVANTGVPNVNMLDLTCHCGLVRLEIKKHPEFIHECNCTLCAKSGARWGYFHPAEVTVTGAGSSYRRKDKAEPASQIHFCSRCGTTTHFTLTESAVTKHGNTMLGINMRLADEQSLAGIELRFPDGKAWSGSGSFTYVQEPRTIGPSKETEYSRSKYERTLGAE
jgi:hypothetical protein